MYKLSIIASHSLCRTLEQLHRAGVVVQDIKPQNVLLDAYGSPVFADFGTSGGYRVFNQMSDRMFNPMCQV